MAETNPFVVRVMDRSHIPGVLEIERASYPAPWSESAFINEMTSETAVAIVALAGDTGETGEARDTGESGETGESGDTVAGYLVGWIVADQVHIANIAVAAGHRRRGAGILMMNWLLEESVRRGCVSSSLEVRESNLAARAMYTRLGYRAVAIRKAYYSNPREDAVVMLKTL